jgi:transposase
MAVSDDLREQVEAVVLGGLSRNQAAARFKVSVANAVRWVKRFNTTGEISPTPSRGDRGSGRIEAHRDYLLGLIRRRPDITLLEASRTGSRLPAVQRDRPSLFSPLDVHDVQVGRG